MAITTEQIIIELISDPSGLDPTIDKLEQIGAVDKQTSDSFKKTNAELAKKIQLEQQAAAQASKEQAIYNKLIASVRTLTGESKKAVQELLKMSAKEISAGFDRAAVDVDDYVLALQEASKQTPVLTDKSVSLRAQLKILTQQLAQLKLAGKDNTDEYRRLNIEAGRLKDTMNDVNAEIKNAGSDTRNIDNVLGSVQALAGGFQAVQGAQALFGEDNEDLQKTLVKLNGVMALTQGVQQITNALQKEGALIKLADVVQTRAQIIAQTVYTAVVGQSTGALRVFKIALAATGIGAVVLLLGFLISKMDLFTSSAQDAAEAQERLNTATTTLNESLVQSNNAYVRVISERKKALEQELALLEARGATERDLTNKRLEIAKEEARIQSLSLENLGLTEVGVARLQLEYDGLTRKLNALAQVIREDPSEARLKSAEELAKRLQAQQAAIKPLIDAGNDALERRGAALNEVALLEVKFTQIIKAETLRRLQDELAALQVKLIAAEKNSEEELNIQRSIIRKKAEIDLQEEKLTANQRKLIRAEADKEQLELRKEFLRKSNELALQNFISANNVELNRLNISNADKLRLTEDNLFAAAAIEIAAADGNGKKIKEIEAKRDADVREARLKSIQETLARELELTDAVNGPAARAAERVIASDRATLAGRLRAIQTLVDFELAANDKKLAALELEKSKKLISEKEYEVQYEKLVDEGVKAFEEGEKRKRDATKKTSDERLKDIIADVNTVVETASRMAGILEGLNSLRSEQEAQRFAAAREQITGLREAGAITEKEEQARLKRLDIEERKARQAQANRDKQAAVFRALLAIPQAVLQGLALGGPLLGALFGALAGAQLAIIASKPIPKFNVGKKNRYAGLGQVAEQNPEIVERDGRMYLVSKPTVLNLRADDKVYNPAETREMLYRGQDKTSPRATVVDADAIGKAVARHMPQFGLKIDEDGFSEYMWDKQLYIRNLNNRRLF